MRSVSLYAASHSDPAPSVDMMVHRWFSVTAHAVGGDSASSEAVELQPAPRPISFVADDYGDNACGMSEGDTLTITFDRPTNQAGGSPLNRSLVSAAALASSPSPHR